MFVVAVESIFIFGLARWRVLSFLFFGTGKYCDGMGLFAYCVSMSVPCKLEKVCFWGGSCRKRSWSRFVEQVYACASKTFGLRFFSFTISKCVYLRDGDVLPPRRDSVTSAEVHYYLRGGTVSPPRRDELL